MYQCITNLTSCNSYPFKRINENEPLNSSKSKIILLIEFKQPAKLQNSVRQFMSLFYVLYFPVLPFSVHCAVFTHHTGPSFSCYCSAIFWSVTVAARMRSNTLQLNITVTKTEILPCTTGRRFHQLPQSLLRVGSDYVTPASVAHDLTCMGSNSIRCPLTHQ